MFNKILVAVDLDDDTQNENLLRAAAEQAKISGAEIYLLNIVAAPPPDVSQFLPERYEQMTVDRIKKKLATVAANSALKDSITNVCVRFGDAYREILAQADNVDADMIIVAPHKPHVSDYLLGTTAARIVRHARCSTLVVRQSEAPVDV